MGKLSHCFIVKGCQKCKSHVKVMYMSPKCKKFLMPKLKSEQNIVNSFYVSERTHINRAPLISFENNGLRTKRIFSITLS
jgi:hypothetical protein